MIVNVRGTSGSGKSHLVKQVVDHMTQRHLSPTKEFQDRRRKPLAYQWTFRDAPERNLYIPGHYESPCGGCDTIKTMDLVADMVRRAYGIGFNVLFEGLLYSEETKRTLNMYLEEGRDIHIVKLTTPLDVCINSVNKRRQARMGDKFTPVNPKPTVEKKFYTTHRACDKLRRRGVPVTYVSRETALNHVLDLLGEEVF